MIQSTMHLLLDFRVMHKSYLEGIMTQGVALDDSGVRTVDVRDHTVKGREKAYDMALLSVQP